MGGNELKLVRQDLEEGGHRIAGVVRLNNRNQDPFLASNQRNCPVKYGSVPHSSVRPNVKPKQQFRSNQVQERLALTRAGLLLCEL